MTSRLLPPNATRLERALADATAIVLDPTPVRHVLDAARCPPAVLPVLAWERSIDDFDQQRLSLQQQRSLIAESVAVHKIKGTLGAVRRALSALGVVITVKEWQQHGGVPFTVAINLSANDHFGRLPMTSELYRVVRAAVHESRNERSRVSISISATLNDPLQLNQGCRALTICRTRMEIA